MPVEMPSSFLRLFIAIPVPMEVREALGRAQGQLRRCSPPGSVRWTNPEQFHLTLNFLGDVMPDQAAALRGPTEKIVASFSALTLSAHGTGFFPGEHKPRVIWCGVIDANGQLNELQRELGEAVRPLTAAEKAERFSGHITLGRVKPGHHGSLRPVLERARVLRDRHFGEWLAREVIIYRSTLTPQGAVHEPFHVCPMSV